MLVKARWPAEALFFAEVTYGSKWPTGRVWTSLPRLRPALLMDAAPFLPAPTAAPPPTALPYLPCTLAWLQGHPGRSIPPECGLRAPRAGASWKQGSWMNLLVEACLGGDPGPNLRCQAQRWLEQVPGARASGSVWTLTRAVERSGRSRVGTSTDPRQALLGPSTPRQGAQTPKAGIHESVWGRWSEPECGQLPGHNPWLHPVPTR